MHRSPPHHSALAALLLGLIGSGCYGGNHQTPERGSPAADDASAGDAGSGDDDGGGVPSLPEGGIDVASSFGRLARPELVGALGDVLGLAPDEIEHGLTAIGRDPRLAHGFRGPSLLDEQLYVDLAAAIEDLVARSRWSELDPEWARDCEGDTSPACVEQLAQRVARRAYRRPVTAAEIDALTSVYTALRESEHPVSHDDALRGVVEVILLSPDFLYHQERAPGEEPTVIDGYEVLSSHEIAARLSFLLWSTIPDAELSATADDGSLLEPVELERQARRLLSDPRATRTIERFVAQWLEVDDLDDLMRHSPEDGAVLTERLARSMREQLAAYVAHVLDEDDGTFEALVDSDWLALDAELAEHFGWPAPAEPGTFELTRVEPASGRGGLLTQGAMLVAHAAEREAAPTRFGHRVRTRLLCDDVPAPSSDIDTTLPETSEDESIRERLEAHVSDATCQGCHQLIDPLGFPALAYDALGRQVDRGEDTSGSLVSGDTRREFADIGELTTAIAEDPRARTCFVRQLLRFASRVDPGSSGAARAIDERFAGSALVIREVMLAIATSPLIRYRYQED